MTPAGRSIMLPLLIIAVGILGSTLGFVGTASGNARNSANAQEVVTGSGLAGSGSLAVAAFFNLASSSGAGAFSGTVGGVATSGLFSLSVSNPSNPPVLHCPNGQVSFGGTVTTGSFKGDTALISICVMNQGQPVPGAFVMFSIISQDDFSGQGTGTSTVSSLPITVGFVAAGVTSGSGSTGSGTVYTAEADIVVGDGSVMVGGAFLGSFLSQVGNTWTGNKASVQPGCTLNTSGVTASFGSFPNQPVSSSYTLLTCPPSSIGPQTARFVYAIGGDVNPVYKGIGTARLDPYKNF